ncbi:hypothetical protein WS65_27015 [Burkholderia anthina]|uniref:Uncharacterized protein n=1 Tax=Burkholderia anthina TaxID=179879 RepID=A0AAW3PZF5_9BURK|nr:hypothetical protein WS65_27015 [Burkholderia anthina]KWZ34898.1 hypothetical protein WS64_04730 [Burkholderia anthina]
MTEPADHIAGVHPLGFFEHDDRIQRLRIDDEVKLLLKYVSEGCMRGYGFADDRCHRLPRLDRTDLDPARTCFCLLIRS